jgi:hypothetical protein
MLRSVCSAPRPIIPGTQGQRRRGHPLVPHYVEAVLDYNRPTTVKELQAHICLLNFYRRFLPGIAKVLRPLMDALHGDKSASDEVPCMIS